MPTARPMRSASRSCTRCRRNRARRASVPGRAARSRRAPRLARAHRRRRQREISARLCAIHRRARARAWRRPARRLARHGRQRGRLGAPNPDQLARYIENGCHWHRDVPAAARYYKMANRDYLEWAKSLGFVGSTGADHAPVLCRNAAAIPSRRARPRRDAAARARSRARGTLFRSAAVLVCVARRRRVVTHFFARVSDDTSCPPIATPHPFSPCGRRPG